MSSNLSFFVSLQGDYNTFPSISSWFNLKITKRKFAKPPYLHAKYSPLYKVFKKICDSARIGQPLHHRSAEGANQVQGLADCPGRPRGRSHLYGGRGGRRGHRGAGRGGRHRGGAQSFCCA